MIEIIKTKELLKNIEAKIEAWKSGDLYIHGEDVDIIEMLRQAWVYICELKPHLLTWKEIDECLEDDDPIVWIERRERHFGLWGKSEVQAYQICYNNHDDRERNIRAELPGILDYFYFNRETFGIKWRVWSSCPTKEEREAAKWN